MGTRGGLQLAAGHVANDRDERVGGRAQQALGLRRAIEPELTVMSAVIKGGRFAPDCSLEEAGFEPSAPSRGCRLILGEEKGPAVDQIVSKDAVLFTGDQWFESVFLRRGVLCELTFGDFEEVLAALVGRG
jgi:hypothetical protein